MIRGKRTFNAAFDRDQDIIVDYFRQHLDKVLDSSIAEKLLLPNDVFSEPKRIVLDIGTGFLHRRYELSGNIPKLEDIKHFGLNSKLVKNFEIINGKPITCEQLSLYGIIGKYIDLCAAELKFNYTPLYCLHALNHIIRSRNLIIENKQFLQNCREKGALTEDDIENTRDQGLSRPKVLIICPMKKDAFTVIETFRILVFGDSEKPFVSNYRRFKTEFGDTGFRISEKRKVSDEYRNLMSGNIDDCFRIGVAVAKKSLKLYTAFDDSDILIASPLGLRMIVGENNEDGDKGETDFLASIEILIIDKADLLLMQNWEHLLNVLSSLHKRPKKLAVDISRVRSWCLEQYSKLYRHTIMISEERHAECDAVFAFYCHNFAGLFKLLPPNEGLLDKIEIHYCQELQQIEVDRAEDQSDARFKFFKENVLPKCEFGAAVFIPSYFDFVRIRNYLKNENESFVQLHEYAKEGKVAKARALFYKKEKKIMLITERFHFYRRYNIKGIKSLIFYQPPAQSRFYYEIINQVNEDCAHVRVLYTKFDLVRMANIFGDRCMQKIMSSGKSMHALISK